MDFLKRVILPVLVLLAFPMLAASSRAAEALPFDALKAEIWPQAEAEGITRVLFEEAFAGLTPDPDVLREASAQPEFMLTTAQYLEQAVSAERVAEGLKALGKHNKDLGAIERRYGVSRFVLVAIWGIESDYGTEPGTKPVIRSLSTLAEFDRKRSAFAKTQIVEALKIVQSGSAKLSDLVGSWAGAMGHTQFIPSTYNRYAVDFNGDGKRDIWATPVDALASTANYLSQSGWKSGERWGYSVTFPANWREDGLETETKTIRQWRMLGLTVSPAVAYRKQSTVAQLYSREGSKGLSFLLGYNFSALKTYNRSDLYGIAVGSLADRLFAEHSRRKRASATEVGYRVLA